MNLLPKWKEERAPIKTKVNPKKNFYFLGKNKIFKLANLASTFGSEKPQQLYYKSCKSYADGLQSRLKNLVVEIFPGFPASEVLYHENGSS